MKKSSSALTPRAASHLIHPTLSAPSKGKAVSLGPECANKRHLFRVRKRTRLKVR